MIIKEKIDEVKKILAGDRYEIANDIPVIIVDRLLDTMAALRQLVEWAIEMGVEWHLEDILSEFYDEDNLKQLYNNNRLDYEDYLVTLTQIYLREKEKQKNAEITSS